MSLITIYTFTNPDNYIYNTDKIDVSEEEVVLKIEDSAGLTFSEDFFDDTDFTYDSDKSEFVGGQVQQKDARPTNATFYAAFSTDINGNWGGGVLTGTATGGATVGGGKLLLNNSDIRYVDYAGVDNADVLVQTGCIRFKVTPNYTGSPATDMFFVASSLADSNVNNAIQIRHYNTTGQLRCQIFDSTGGAIENTDFGVWSPTAATEYEFEINFDVTVGAIRLFIDGTQFGATKVTTGTRSSSIGYFRIGANYLSNAVSNFSIQDVIIFDDVQHIANYTPDWSDIYETIYLTDLITLPSMTYPGAGSIQAFTNITATEANNPRYIVNDLYYNGGWIASSGTWATANTISDILTNIDTLPAADNVVIKIVTQNSSATQQNVSDLTLTYTGQTYPIDSPTIKPVSTLLVEGVSAFTATVTELGSDTVTFTIEVDGVEYYWTGAVWSVGGSFNNSNSYSDINTNITDLDLTGGKEIKFVAYIHSDDGGTAPELSKVSITYDLHGTLPGDVNTCMVYGYIYNSESTPIENATIKAKLTTKGIYNDKIIITTNIVETTTDINGYWELNLVENESMQSGVGYEFEFIIDGVNGTKYLKTVPNTESINFIDLINFTGE